MYYILIKLYFKGEFMDKYQYENIKSSFFSNNSSEKEHLLYSQLFQNICLKEELHKFILKKTFVENILLSILTVFFILTISLLIFGLHFRFEIHFLMLLVGVFISYFINRYIQLDKYSFISKKEIYKKFYSISSLSEAEIIFTIVLNRYPGYFIPISYFSLNQFNKDIPIIDIPKINSIIWDNYHVDFSSFLKLL